MKNFRVIFRSVIDGTDLRTIVKAFDAHGAEKAARVSINPSFRYKCVRIQPV